MPNLFKLLAVGNATSNDSNKIENSVVTGADHFTTIGTKPEQAHSIIDNAQQTEQKVKGEVAQSVGVTKTHPVEAVSHVWDNPELKTTLTKFVPIPWLEDRI